MRRPEKTLEGPRRPEKALEGPEFSNPLPEPFPFCAGLLQNRNAIWLDNS